MIWLSVLLRRAILALLILWIAVAAMGATDISTTARLFSSVEDVFARLQHRV